MALRFFLYAWAFPTTAIGLLFVPDALFSGRVAIVDGVVEVHGALARFFLQHCTFLQGGAVAMTLGHVVIARNQRVLMETRAHERIHVRQCERWGPLFIPAYLFMSAVQWCRGRRPYEDNPFEREAYGASE